MSKAMIASTGQVTIPGEVREQLELSAGYKLLFEVEEVIRLRLLKCSSLGDLKGSLVAVASFDRDFERLGVESSARDCSAPALLEDAWRCAETPLSVNLSSPGKGKSLQGSDH